MLYLDRTYGRAYSADPILKHVSPNSGGSCFVPIFLSYWGTSELIKDTKGESLELDSERERDDASSDSDDKREGHGMDEEGQGLDDEGQGLKDEGPRMEEEQAAPEGEQQAVLVVNTAASEPLGLGYGAARRRALESTNEITHSTYKVGQSSRSAPERRRDQRGYLHLGMVTGEKKLITHVYPHVNGRVILLFFTRGWVVGENLYPYVGDGTTRMAVRTQPTLSSSMSARIVEAAALSPSSFCKRYISSYETPLSSLTLLARKSYRGISKLILDIDSEGDELGEEDSKEDSKKDSKEDESLDADDEREWSDDEGHGLAGSRNGICV
nr:hypothetical protein [Tanacetum cinerariifolium]